MIIKDLGSDHLNTMADTFNSLGQDGLYMTHYQLADETEFSTEEWREFLNNSEVKEYINSELATIAKVERAKLMRDASKKQGQVGTAQMITALSKLDTSSDKTGPVFIYSYIPMNTKEKKQDTTEKIILADDPFKSEV